MEKFDTDININCFVHVALKVKGMSRNISTWYGVVNFSMLWVDVLVQNMLCYYVRTWIYLSYFLHVELSSIIFCNKELNT